MSNNIYEKMEEGYSGYSGPTKQKVKRKREETNWKDVAFKNMSPATNTFIDQLGRPYPHPNFPPTPQTTSYPLSKLIAMGSFKDIPEEDYGQFVVIDRGGTRRRRMRMKRGTRGTRKTTRKFKTRKMKRRRNNKN
jgi:hypothetical protein